MPHFQVEGLKRVERNHVFLVSARWLVPQLPLKNFQKAHKTNSIGKTTQANGRRETNQPQVNTPTPLINKPDNTALIAKGKRLHILYMELEIVDFFITKVFSAKMWMVQVAVDRMHEVEPFKLVRGFTGRNPNGLLALLLPEFCRGKAGVFFK